MEPLQSRIKRAEHGIDAPTVVRNFFLIGVAGLLVGSMLAQFGSRHLPNWMVRRIPVRVIRPRRRQTQQLGPKRGLSVARPSSRQV